MTNYMQPALSSASEAVAKGKIVWAGNMLPVAVRATRPPLPKFNETPFLAQKSPYFYQNGVKNKAVGGSPTLQQHAQTLLRQPRVRESGGREGWLHKISHFRAKIPNFAQPGG